MITLLVIALIVLVFDIVVGFFGVDSRPGFSDGRADVKDRWFVHSKADYRR